LNNLNKDTQEKLFKEAESLSALMRNLHQGQFQIREQALRVLIIFFVVAFVIICILAHTFALDINNTIVLTGGLTLTLMILFFLFKTQKLQFNQGAGFIIVSTCLVFYVVAIIVKGTDPLFYLPSLLVLVSIMINPRWSLVFNLGLIGLATYTLFLSSIEEKQSARMLIDFMTTFLIMQVVMRERGLLGKKTAAILDSLSELSSRLSISLVEITKERNDALLRDSQTGLLTPSSLKKELSTYIETHPTEDLVLCSLRILQLDEFLIVNNGKFDDLILDNLVKKIGQLFRPELTARTSKGEFVGVLNNDNLEQLTEEHIQKILTNYQASFDIKNESLLSAQRVGIAFWPDDGNNVDELISNSNMALLKAIELDTINPVYFHHQMSTDLQKTFKLASEIEEAIHENHFELFFQPIVFRNPHKFTKVEALLRWNHPQLGLLGPNLFIPLATNNGSIIKLTNWVLEQSIQKLKILQSENSLEFRVSINFPPECLNFCVDHPEYMDYFKSFGNQIQGIVLEITEGALLYVTPEILKVIYELKKIGFQLALDDFGVGYSSLSQLNQLPFDYLKIDKSLIDNIESSSKSLLICKFITQLAHEFDCEVISEGVETTQQLSLLDDVGMDFVQGYVYSKPIQFEALRKFVIDPKLMNQL